MFSQRATAARSARGRVLIVKLESMPGWVSEERRELFFEKCAKSLFSLDDTCAPRLPDCRLIDGGERSLLGIAVSLSCEREERESIGKKGRDAAAAKSRGIITSYRNV